MTDPPKPTEHEEIHQSIIKQTDAIVLATLTAKRENGEELSAAMLAELTKRYGTNSEPPPINLQLADMEDED